MSSFSATTLSKPSKRRSSGTPSSSNTVRLPPATVPPLRILILAGFGGAIAGSGPRSSLSPASSSSGLIVRFTCSRGPPLVSEGSPRSGWSVAARFCFSARLPPTTLGSRRSAVLRARSRLSLSRGCSFLRFGASTRPSSSSSSSLLASATATARRFPRVVPPLSSSSSSLPSSSPSSSSSSSSSPPLPVALMASSCEICQERSLDF
mmetsp:Transcript_50517/g.131423  ORF Transcript_50517/g.131423 Transcript_50517/m.131423 type:complete len:207 (+) Transcript_50517:658-1278(+)